MFAELYEKRKLSIDTSQAYPARFSQRRYHNAGKVVEAEQKEFLQIHGIGNTTIPIVEVALSERQLSFAQQEK